MSDEVHIQIEAPDHQPGAYTSDRTTGPRTVDRSLPGRVLVAGLAVLVVLGIAAGVASLLSDTGSRGGVDAGDADDLRRERVTYVRAADAFVVATGDGFLGLHARSTHLRVPVRFCEPSQWFEDPAYGSKWDQMGYYRAGPAPRGLDRFRVRIEDGRVIVDPSVVAKGPPRGAHSGQGPQGPFCVDTAGAHG